MFVHSSALAGEFGKPPEDSASVSVAQEPLASTKQEVQGQFKVCGVRDKDAVSTQRQDPRLCGQLGDRCLLATPKLPHLLLRKSHGRTQLGWRLHLRAKMPTSD